VVRSAGLDDWRIPNYLVSVWNRTTIPQSSIPYPGRYTDCAVPAFMACCSNLAIVQFLIDFFLSIYTPSLRQKIVFGRYVPVAFRSPGQPLSSTGTVTYRGAVYRFGVGDVRWLPYNSFWVERSNLMSANQCLLQLKIAAIL
jgi:hypothetical protein